MNRERRSARSTTVCEVEFRQRGGPRYAVSLVDLSPEGARFEPPIRVSLDEEVWLRIPGIEPRLGRVCWVEKWQVGIEFVQPFHAAVFEHVLEALQTLPGPSAV